MELFITKTVGRGKRKITVSIKASKVSEYYRDRGNNIISHDRLDEQYLNKEISLYKYAKKYGEFVEVLEPISNTTVNNQIKANERFVKREAIKRGLDQKPSAERGKAKMYTMLKNNLM